MITGVDTINDMVEFARKVEIVISNRVMISNTMGGLLAPGSWLGSWGGLG